MPVFCDDGHSSAMSFAVDFPTVSDLSLCDLSPEEFQQTESQKNRGKLLKSVGFNQLKEASWKGNYCCVPDCKNASAQQKEKELLGLSKVSFHSFPTDKHFTSSDYFPTSDKPNSRRRLLPTAVPSVFQWTSKSFQCRSVTSMKASSSLEFSEHATDEHDDSESDVVTDDASDVHNFEDYYSRDQEDVATKTALLDEIERLKLQVKQLQDKLAESQRTSTKSLFRLDNIKEDSDLVKFYTGFSDYATLATFYEQVLESDAKVMRQWDSRRCKEACGDTKHGPCCKLPLLEQLFMTLVRLRLGLYERDLAVRFGVSQSTVSRTTTWINLMYHSFKAIERFPPWHIVKKYKPEIFKRNYPNTRVIIDATEFAIERPSSLSSQSSTFSTYKNKNTVKVLLGITPSGAISFVSKCYEGSISDKRLVEVSGLLEKLDAGDEIIADKGFLIQDTLAPLGVRLNVPPLLKSDRQMASEDVILTKKIAQLRVHVEREIGRVKDFHILQNALPAVMWDTINQVIYVCCMLTNFDPPLVA
ncbi:uncharacterized protein [Dysidea avara]|uniref:uncharacterized protein n=1 Tax=Dysidea avara TaxID=196820 RepID=UPI003327B2DB